MDSEASPTGRSPRTISFELFHSPHRKLFPYFSTDNIYHLFIFTDFIWTEVMFCDLIQFQVFSAHLTNDDHPL